MISSSRIWIDQEHYEASISCSRDRDVRTAYAFWKLKILCAISQKELRKGTKQAHKSSSQTCKVSVMKTHLSTVSWKNIHSQSIDLILQHNGGWSPELWARCPLGWCRTRRTMKRIGGIPPLNLRTQTIDIGFLQGAMYELKSHSAPLYSRKLHMRVRRARTSCVTSLTILAFVFGGSVVNHFASRTLPVHSASAYWLEDNLWAHYIPCRDTRRM